MALRVIARDGYELGSAGRLGLPCHILPHADGRDGMFGMVTALIVS